MSHDGKRTQSSMIGPAFCPPIHAPLQSPQSHRVLDAQDGRGRRGRPRAAPQKRRRAREERAAEGVGAQPGMPPRASAGRRRALGGARLGDVGRKRRSSAVWCGVVEGCQMELLNLGWCTGPVGPPRPCMIHRYPRLTTGRRVKPMPASWGELKPRA